MGGVGEDIERSESGKVLKKTLSVVVDVASQLNGADSTG